MRVIQLLGPVLLLVGVLATSASAQDPTAPLVTPQEAPKNELSIEALEADVERTRTSDLAEDEKARVVEKYQQALAQIQRRNEWNAQHDEDVRLQEESPARLAALQEQLAVEPSDAPLESPEDATFRDLQQLLAQAEADLAAAQKQATDLEQEQRDRGERRTQLPTRLAEARGKLAEVEAEVAALPDEASDSELDRAVRLSVLARRAAIQAEIRAYEQEIASFDERDELLIAQRTQASRRVAQADKRVKAWRERVNEQRRLDAEADAQAAQVALEETARNIDVLKPLADANTELSAQRKDLGAKIESIAARLDDVRETLGELAAQYETVQLKYDAAGGTPAIGLLLKDHRDRLLDVGEYRAARQARLAEQGDIELKRIDYTDEAERLVDLDQEVREFVDALENPPTGEADRDELEAAVREQLQIRQGILSAVLVDVRTYLSGLVDLSIAEKELIDLAEDFGAYIDERVLWVRIAPPLHTQYMETWASTREAIAWLSDGPAWAELVGRLPTTVRNDAIGIAAQLLLVILLVFTRPVMRRRIADDAYLLGRIRTDRFTHTVRTTILTGLLAVGPPLVVWFAADLFQEAAGADLVLGRVVAAGLRVAAIGYFVGELVWTMSRRRGLGEAHFRWPVASLKLLRRHVRWLMLFGLPVVFVLGALAALPSSSAFGESLGRLTFMTGQLLLAIFAWQVLRPAKGVLRFVIERQPNSWTSRLRYIWFPLSVGLPLLLFGLAALGYLYTALQLQIRVANTAMLVGGVILVHALAMRWLFVARRQLGLQQHRKRRALAQAESGASSASLSDEYAEEEDIDIPSVSAQSQRFVQVFAGFALAGGLLLIWVGVLPALNVFDEVRLWDHTYEVEGDGGTQTVIDPITLRDLLIAVVVLLITVAAARNLPGLLEIAVLQRLPLQRAGRYAITTIARYLISIIGLALMFGAVGIGWDTVQWLAAAVSVGLGFGLQEIFANFVSGIILLFERPIRVGDTVTVDDVTGTVTRIHMRATTIVTWDRTELIVPNREFITSQLVNWTLSDSVLRVVVKVGIAYGSDTKKAEELLHKVARENPDVLEEPKPRVVFTEFGDSTLNFELRVFVTDPELFRTISHPINNAIDREFKAHGIEIAFPQRDLHIRSSDVPIPYIPQQAIVQDPGGHRV